MNTTRRGIFQFIGGSAMGAIFTPAPWRLVTDTALWSENWPGIPHPVRGEIRARFTHCSLCNAGCAVRARCVGDQPVSLAGCGGGLCPFGLTAHHLPYHPARLKQGPVHEAAAAVEAAIAQLSPSEKVAVLDLRPGRTASWNYRRAMAGRKNGIYLAPPEPSVSVHLQNARTVLSLGAPLLDGWIAPGNAFAARPGFRLIQAEPVESRTAALADLWLPIRPGSEGALAEGIASQIGLSDAAAATGLSQEQIQSLTDQLEAHGPSLVIDPRMSPVVVALNVHLGAWGKTIGPRPEVPVPDSWKKAVAATPLDAVADRSIRVLLIDESAAGEFIPWQAIEPKLAANRVVVAFSWSSKGYGRYADYCLPAALYPEAAGDIPAAIDSPVAEFRMTNPLVAAPQGLATPSEFIGKLDLQQSLRERADAIHQSARGTLLTYADGKSTPVKEVKADDFWKALGTGARWVDDPRPIAGTAPIPSRDMKVAAAQPFSADYPLTIVSEARISGLGSPLLSQIYQESNLRLAPDRIALHPSDASSFGIADSTAAMLHTGRGKREVRVTVDSSIRPGVVLIAGDPDLASTGAKVVRI